MISCRKVGAGVVAAAALVSVAVTFRSAAASPVAPASQPVRRLSVTGPAKADEVYVPVVPCRIADTRKAGGAITGGTSRSVQVRGSSGFAAQGGNSSGCGIPAAALSVVLSVTSVGAAKDGFFIGYPGNTTKPSANFAWYWHDRTSTSNPTLALSPSGPSDLKIYASATTQLVVDVQGYFEEQIAGYVESNSTGWQLVSATSRVVEATRTGKGQYHLRTDTGLDSCAVVATSPGNIDVAARTFGSSVNVDLYDSSGQLIDASFNFLVSC